MPGLNVHRIMHRILATRVSSMSRQVSDKGDLVTTKEKELERLPFSARTPRVTSRTQTQTPKKPPTREIRPQTARRPKSRQKTQVDLDDPRQVARNLASNGVHTTKIREKDEIIGQLGDMLVEQINQNDIYQSDISRLTDQVSHLELFVTNMSHVSERTQRNCERISQLRHLKTIRADSRIVEEIKEIEADAAKYMSLSEPWLLQDILDGKEEERIENLVNLKFRRLEDLVFGLRKQLLQEHDIVSLLPSITEKFGSVRNLLAKYDESQETIRKLKVREFKCSEDELARRRQLSSCSTQTLHMLIVALQNEVMETRAQLRMAMQFSAKQGVKSVPDVKTVPLEFDLVSEHNVLEAKYKDLAEHCADLRKDNEMLSEEIDLESRVLQNGIFKGEEHLKKRLYEANERMIKYEKEIAKKQETIDLQMKLVNQFQREKAAAIRQKMVLEAEVEEMKRQVAEAQFAVRKTERKMKTVRGLARLMAENTLGKRQDYDRTWNELENCFFHAYEKYDSAALVIQRAWRKKRNPTEEKAIIKRPTGIPVPQIMIISALDAVAGNMKPVEYKQIADLLKSYNSEVRDTLRGRFTLMKEYLAETHRSSYEILEGILCKGKRFQWTQTEPERTDQEVQTEKVVPHRGKK